MMFIWKKTDTLRRGMRNSEVRIRFQMFVAGCTGFHLPFFGNNQLFFSAFILWWKTWTLSMPSFLNILIFDPITTTIIESKWISVSIWQIKKKKKMKAYRAKMIFPGLCNQQVTEWGFNQTKLCFSQNALLY